MPVASYSYTPNGDLLATHTYTNGTDVITESYAYDMLGNRIATTDALGNTIYRTYDPFGRVTAEWGATYPVRYTYDTAGHRTSLTTFRATGGTQFIASADLGNKPYSMLSWGSSIAILNRITPVQYNCQDYADDLRREYDRLMKDPCERKKCGLK